MKSEVIAKHENEIWLQLKEFPAYSVSDQGRVRRNKTGRVLIASANGSGYLHVTPSMNGVKKTVRVHVAVAEAFIGPRPAGLQINHISPIKSDNRLVNIEYTTAKNNTAHAIRLKLRPRSNFQKFQKSDIIKIRRMAKRKNKRTGKPYYSIAQIAKIAGCTAANIRAIVSYKTWRI